MQAKETVLLVVEISCAMHPPVTMALSIVCWQNGNSTLICLIPGSTCDQNSIGLQLDQRNGSYSVSPHIKANPLLYLLPAHNFDFPLYHITFTNNGFSSSFHQKPQGRSGKKPDCRRYSTRSDMLLSDRRMSLQVCSQSRVFLQS